MATENKKDLRPTSNEPQTSNPTKKQIGEQRGKDTPHDPPVKRDDTSHTKNTANSIGLNEEQVDSNEREQLN